MEIIKSYCQFINESSSYYDDEDLDLLDGFQFFYTFNRGQITKLTEAVINLDFNADGSDSYKIHQSNAVVYPYTKWDGVFKKVLDNELSKFDIPNGIESLGDKVNTPSVYVLFKDYDIFIIFENENFKKFSKDNTSLKIWIKMSAISNLSEAQRKNIFKSIGLDFTTFYWSDSGSAYEEGDMLRMIKRELLFTENEKEQIEMISRNVEKSYESACTVFPSFIKMFGKKRTVLGKNGNALSLPKGMEISNNVNGSILGFLYDTGENELDVVIHWKGRKKDGYEVTRFGHTPSVIKITPDDYDVDDYNGIKFSSEQLWEAMKIIVDEVLS